jgi:hypothetical protein
MLGGTSGAGKSTYLKTDEGKALMGERAVKIDSDEIKSQMREYRDIQINDTNWKGAAAFVHDESSIISDRAMKLAVEGKYNVVFDGTGDGDIDRFSGRIEVMAKTGPVDMVYVAMSLPESLKSVEYRAKTERRFIPDYAVRSIHPGVSARFKDAVMFQKSGRVRNITLVRRAGATAKEFTPIGRTTGGRFVVSNIKHYTEFERYSKED